jgi:DNA-binding protein HU-beta
MNKSELIDAVAQRTGQTKGDTGKSLDALIDVIIEAVVAGDKVQLVGFGTFEPQHRAARSGRNPSTGAAIEIAASTAPKFAPGKAFKDKVAGR